MNKIILCITAIFSLNTFAQTPCMTSINKDHNQSDHGQPLVSQTYLKTYTPEDMNNFEHIKDLRSVGETMGAFKKTRYHVMYMDNPANPSILVIESNADPKEATAVEKAIKAILPVDTSLTLMHQHIQKCKKH